MQEAFHNAIKHSKGTKITIELISNNGLQIRVTDNGNGIHLNKSLQGNGLHNMQLRAKANGWQLLIRNINPKGTSVELYTLNTTN